MEYTIGMQVLVDAVKEEPKKSWDLRRRYMGVAYAEASKNNAAYNRMRKQAVKNDFLKQQEDKLYTLGENGHKLIAWAKKEGINLSEVKSEMQIAYEVQNGIV